MHDLVISRHRPRPEVLSGLRPRGRHLGPVVSGRRARLVETGLPHHTLRCPPVSRNPMTPRRDNRFMHPSSPASPFGSSHRPQRRLLTLPGPRTSIHSPHSRRRRAGSVRPAPRPRAQRFSRFTGTNPARSHASGLLARPSAAAPCRQEQPQRSAHACGVWWMMFASCRLPGKDF